MVFNDGLRARQTARENGEKYLSDGDLSKQVITNAKTTPERAWLGEVSSVVLQQALADLNVAYRTFFASISGKRRGRKVAPPRFLAMPPPCLAASAIRPAMAQGGSHSQPKH